MIYTDKLPNKCTQCSCYNVDYEEGADCNLGTWENHSFDNDYYNDCEKARHPNCPLILIERWRLESCQTCFNKDGFNCKHESEYIFNENMTCPNWQPIENNQI